MKVAIITDQHFGMRKGSQIFHDYMKKFYDEVFFPFLDKNKITTVLDLGDTFDNRKSIDFWSLDWAKKNYYDNLAQRGIKVYTVVGNHTAYYKNTLGINAINLLLQEYDNVQLIERPETINVGGLDICFVPWICVDNETETYQEIANTSANICMGHLELSGFEAHQGYYMDHGMSRDVFSKFKKVFSGHFHHRSHSDNIYYLGNPYQMYWNDFGDVRGFHLFDTQTTKLKFIANPFKMFEKIYYNDSAENPDEIDTNQYKEKFVKLIVEKRTNYYAYDNLIERLYQVGVHDLKIIDNTNEEINPSGDIEIEGTLSFLERYVEEIDYEDKDTLKSIIGSIYTESLQIE
jgi:DNA repair exonuclease SbcCD nuclease subunit|tara:strand:+ start:1041 stop:2081 length:1041 start_codon:yes stop_codon:yes gene_type:complete